MFTNEQRAPENGALTEAQAAEYLHCGLSTLRRYRQQGIGPEHARYPGGNIRYRIADLDAWVAARMEQ